MMLRGFYNDNCSSAGIKFPIVLSRDSQLVTPERKQLRHDKGEKRQLGSIFARARESSRILRHCGVRRSDEEEQSDPRCRHRHSHIHTRKRKGISALGQWRDRIFFAASIAFVATRPRRLPIKEPPL